MKKPTVITKNVKGTSLKPAVKSTKNGNNARAAAPSTKPDVTGVEGIRRFLAPSTSVSTSTAQTSAKVDSESSERGAVKEKGKRRPIGQSASKANSTRKALGERNTATKVTKGTSAKIPSSPCGDSATSKRKLEDRAKPSNTKASPSKTESANIKVSSPESRKSLLRPSDSGYYEDDVGHENNGPGPSSGHSPENDWDIPSLSQATPRDKRNKVEPVFWLASPPIEKLKAANARGLPADPEAEMSLLAKMLGTGTTRREENECGSPENDIDNQIERRWLDLAPLPVFDTPAHRKGLKRSFSLSNIESSPSARAKEQKRPKLHWTSAPAHKEGSRRNLNALRELLARCKSVFEESSVRIGSVPNPGNSKDNASKTPDSVKKRRFARSISLPSISDSHKNATNLLTECSATRINKDTLSESGGSVSTPKLSPRGKRNMHNQCEDNKENIAPQEAFALPDRFSNDGRMRGSGNISIVPRNSGTPKSPNSRAKMTNTPGHNQDDDLFDIDDDDFACSMALDVVMQQYGSLMGQTSPDNPFVEHPPTVGSSTAPKVLPDRVPRKRRYQRFLVLEISWNEYGYAMKHGRSREQILRLFDESTTTERYLHLREDWYSAQVNVGDYINVLGEFDPVFNRCIADNEKSLIILHPDVLVSTTYVAESFDCLRKSVLQDRVRSFGELTAPVVYGNLLHRLLQICLAENDFSTAKLNEEIDKLVLESIADLYAIGETEQITTSHLRESVPVLQEWAAKYVGSTPKPEGIVQQHRGNGSDKATICINKVLDIEENIWSPMFGIKGNIDATVQLRVREGFDRVRTLAAPLELKTGRNSKVVSHRAQTTLYTLMMTDRYDVDVATGILYYLKAGDMIKIPSLRDEIRGLIIARNSMALFLNARGKLPPVIRSLHNCQRCYSLDKCLVYHKAVENGTAETSGLGSLFDKRTGHMTPGHIAFFDKWERLITMEEGDMQQLRKEIWTLSGQERENVRSQMRLLPEIGGSEASTKSGRTRVQYKFCRAAPDLPTQDTASLLNSHITVGDPIVISTEEGHYALATGFVMDVQPTVVTVLVDRELRGAPRRMAHFDEASNQDFEGIMEVSPDLASGRKESINANLRQHEKSADHTLYRIDKDELTSGMGVVRANLVSLFAADGDEKRRRLVVDLEPPRFCHEPAGMNFDPSLNTDQRKAVEKVLAAHDYALILGMPGTGKTTTISYIIQTLVKRGKSVLLASYTHTAVDNVLLKLREENVDFLRLGDGRKVHPAIHPYTASAREDIRTVEALEQFYTSKLVVATTCLGINHTIFNKRNFDYCIVDEASQLTLPVCLGPLRFADVFILVGDHYQLPPLVRNAEAKDSGLAVSLFKILCEAHPGAVVNLAHQYRMNQDIMLLSNALIYNHRLRCGTPAVADSKLSIPNLQDGLHGIHVNGSQAAHGVTCKGKECWIKSLVDPSRRVVFVNTDDVPAPESRPGDLVQNDIEAELVRQVVEGLIACGVSETALGIISPYRSQLKLIGHMLKHRPHIAIHTVDKFQGSDKDCMLVSLVRSNKTQNVGDLLRDWRRINVAFTRSKQKLIIFGSRSTLEGTALFAEFLHIIDTNNWGFKLPLGAQKLHFFPSAKKILASQPQRTVPGTESREVQLNTRKRPLVVRKGGAGILQNVLADCGITGVQRK